LREWFVGRGMRDVAGWFKREEREEKALERYL